MASKVQKFNVKSSATPLIKKIYDHPKKWHVSDKTSSSRVKRDVVIIHKKTDHTYANVDYRTTGNTTKKEENVTVVDVPFDSAQSDKLRIVIDNFDKILDEYSKEEDYVLATSTPNKLSVAPFMVDSTVSSTKKETKIPKLVKAKTCSIIESKCILKKTNSQPAGTDGLTNSSSLQNKTKSLGNLVNMKEDVKPIKLSKPQSELEWNKEVQITEKENAIKTQATPGVKDTQSNVKEIVKRLNSLTDSIDGEAINDTTHIHSISKAKSTMDLSLNKKLTLSSRIPVNTTLRKIYPSIPCDLNNLDSDRSSAGTKKQTLNRNFAKSTHNLLETTSSKLSIPRQNRIIHGSVQNVGMVKTRQSLGKSCHNLNSIGKVSVTKTDLTLTKSTQNLTKLPQVRTLEKSNRTKSVQNVSNKIPNCGFNKFSEKISDNNQRKLNTKSNSVRNLAETYDTRKYANSKAPSPVTKTAKILPKLEKNVVSKSLEKLISIGKSQETVDPGDTFVVLKAPKEKVKNVIQKLEEIKNHDKPTTNSKPLNNGTYKVAPKSSILKNTDCFGVQKCQVETKFAEKAATITKSASKKKQVEAIKLNLRRTQDFLEKLETDSVDTSDYYLDPEDFIDDSEKVINFIQLENKQLKSDDSRNEPMKKLLDYNSDNSDDSGNISNEIELDCEDTNLSSESLTTVLDASIVGQDSGIDLTKDSYVEDKKEIFFRNGVLAQLETQRDERLCGVVVRLQARGRGLLARRQMARLRLQDVAVRCVQRNVRRFVAVRDWPWWRLLVRVAPLLNVHRTEEELRMKTDELEAVKVKLEKLENERTKLKHDNDKLEAKQGRGVVIQIPEGILQNV